MEIPTVATLLRNDDLFIKVGRLYAIKGASPNAIKCHKPYKNF